MPGAKDTLRQLAQTARPRTVKRLREAGALSPLAPVALATSLPYLLGRGISLGIVSQMNAITAGSKPAIIDREGSLTWRELDGDVNRTARGLARAGLSGGDKIALLLRNGREIVTVALAAQKLGVIACPLNTWAKTKELKAVIDKLGAQMVVYDTAHSAQVRTSCPEGTTLIHVGEDPDALDGSRSLQDISEGCSALPLLPVAKKRGSARVIIQTSGTTGTPKGAARDASAAGMGALADLLGTVPYRRDDVILCPAPLFHSFGLATFSFATALGATLVLPSRFDPEECLRLIEKHRCTAASFIPVMIRRIVSLEEDRKTSYDLSSLRIVMASGSVLSLDLKKAASELFGDVLYDLYGSTEAGWVAIATPDDIRSKPRSVGKPMDGVEVAIVGEQGEPLEPGETGAIHVRSDLIFDGYTSGDDDGVLDGTVAVGDLGYLDDDGHLFVASRSDDMVVVGGENVYPIEVEETIEQIEGVDEVTVCGMEDDEYGHVLVAFVVGSVTTDDVLNACREELASYKVPRKVEILDELPRTATGKVLKRDLIKRHKA